MQRVNITWNRAGNTFSIEGTSTVRNTQEAISFLQQNRGYGFVEAALQLNQVKYACSNCGVTKNRHSRIQDHSWMPK